MSIMGTPKTEFPTQRWGGGGHFLSTYFLTVKEKEGGHLFFSIFFSKIRKSV
jgi:hypothetical protein